MSEEAGRPEWLPPKAPGAQPPQRWHSVDEAPASEAPPMVGVPAPPSEDPTAGGAAAARGGDWWRHGGAGVGAGASTAPSPGYGAPSPGSFGAPAAAGNGNAVASLSLGIAGLLLFFLSGFGLVFILNLPCSVFAWIFGVKGMRSVDRGETTARRGMAQMGMLLGVIGTVVGGLAIVAWGLGFAFSEELRDEFQREWERQWDRRQRG